jgi:hypothetical protein
MTTTITPLPQSADDCTATIADAESSVVVSHRHDSLRHIFTSMYTTIEQNLPKSHNITCATLLQGGTYDADAAAMARRQALQRLDKMVGVDKPHWSRWLLQITAQQYTMILFRELIVMNAQAAARQEYDYSTMIDFILYARQLAETSTSPRQPLTQKQKEHHKTNIFSSSSGLLSPPQTTTATTRISTMKNGMGTYLQLSLPPPTATTTTMTTTTTTTTTTTRPVDQMQQQQQQRQLL